MSKMGLLELQAYWKTWSGGLIEEHRRVSVAGSCQFKTGMC